MIQIKEPTQKYIDLAEKIIHTREQKLLTPEKTLKECIKAANSIIEEIEKIAMTIPNSTKRKTK